MARKNENDRTEADRKFFALRESGYRGPIDQDGNKVTSGRHAEILAALAEIPSNPKRRS